MERKYLRAKGGGGGREVYKAKGRQIVQYLEALYRDKGSRAL